MRLLIVAVGHRMPAWVDEAFGEYAKRLPREAKLDLVEVKPDKRAEGRPVEAVLEAERERIEAAVPAGFERIALDERGEQLATVDLARRLEGWMGEGKNLAFLIGGADGLHPRLKESARGLLALSRLTLPHGLARVLLAEQLYRAWTVVKGHPYHRV